MLRDTEPRQLPDGSIDYGGGIIGPSEADRQYAKKEVFGDSNWLEHLYVLAKIGIPVGVVGLACASQATPTPPAIVREATATPCDPEAFVRSLKIETPVAIGGVESKDATPTAKEIIPLKVTSWREKAEKCEIPSSEEQAAVHQFNLKHLVLDEVPTATATVTATATREAPTATASPRPTATPTVEGFNLDRVLLNRENPWFNPDLKGVGDGMKQSYGWVLRANLSQVPTGGEGTITVIDARGNQRDFGIANGHTKAGYTPMVPSGCELNPEITFSTAAAVAREVQAGDAVMVMPTPNLQYAITVQGIPNPEGIVCQ